MAEGDPGSEPDPRTHIGHVLADYRDGLLDGLEDAVDAIMEHPELAAALKLKRERDLARKLWHSVGRNG